MADKVAFELVAPERLVVSAPVDMVVVPGSEGDFGVLGGHGPLISTLRPGVIELFEEGTDNRRIFVSGGFAEVDGERCTVLADAVTELDGFDRATAEERVRTAEKQVALADTDEAHARAGRQHEIARALLEALE